jgi:hypothetical protein
VMTTTSRSLTRASAVHRRRVQRSDARPRHAWQSAIVRLSRTIGWSAAFSL